MIEEKKRQEEIEREKMQSHYNVRPVSDTHLDVYKRQVWLPSMDAGCRERQT